MKIINFSDQNAIINRYIVELRYVDIQRNNITLW